MLQAALLLLATLLCVPALAQDAPAADEAAEDTEDARARKTKRQGPRTFEVKFDEHLMLPSDVTLQGLLAYETLTFTVPRSWELSADPVVELNFEHSPQLLGDRSSLTVRVNDHAVTSIELNRKNAVGGTARIAIPRDLLKDYNKLTVLVTQHVTEECEDPFDPSLWTRVNKSSLIRFNYNPKPITEELLDYPFPLYDPLSYGPAELTLVSADDELAPAAVEALGVLGLSLGRIAGYHTVSVREPVATLAQARTHALVVGTPGDNRIVEKLVSQRNLNAGEGLVAMLPHPDDPSLAVLVVTGKDEAGLMKAAQALAGHDRYPVLAGKVAKVRLAESDDPPPSRRTPMPAPADDNFTLADLGIDDQTVRGFYAPPIRIPLQLEGDSKPRLDGAKLELHYGYSAQLDTRLSTLEVRINGVVLHSVALNDEDGEQNAKLTVALPQAVLEPRNEVEVIMHLFPVDFDPCRRVSDRMIWGTIFDSSEFSIRRDHYAMMPDLGLLQHDLWPFTLREGKGETDVILSDAPDRYEGASALQLATEMGRLSTESNPRLVVRTAASGLGDDHAILLVTDGVHSAYKALEGSGDLSLTGDEDRLLKGAGEGDLQQATVDSDYGSIEELLHPSAADKALLVVRGADSADLLDMVRGFKDVRRLIGLAADPEQQTNNLAVFGTIGPPRTLSVGDRQQVGTIPLASRVEQGLRRSWWLIGLMVLLAALLLAAIGRMWAGGKGGRT